MNRLRLALSLALLLSSATLSFGQLQNNDLVFGLSNSDGLVNLELVRNGAAVPDFWDQQWVASLAFDNLGGTRNNTLMPEDLNPFGAAYEAAVIDPPRAGAEAQVAQLADAGTPTIAYVSCNPVTFARDAAHLVSAGYALNWVQVVDQFRWSGHAELVAHFTKNT